MKEAGQRYVQRVYADKNDKRLAGSKADLLREIAFEAGAKAGPELPERGYAHYDLLGFVDKMGGTVGTWCEYLRQLANDAMIIIHKRPGGRKIIFVANEAGIAKFKEIVNAEREKDKARADRRAAAAERRLATAALVGAGRVQPAADTNQPAADTNTEDENELPVADQPDAVGCFFVVDYSKDFCAKAQGKLWTSQFFLGKEPTKIEFFPKIFGTFESKLGCLFLLPSLFLWNSSSSSYLLKPCVDSGYSTDDDEVDASLSGKEEQPLDEAQDEELALDSEGEEDSSDANLSENEEDHDPLPTRDEEEREEDDHLPDHLPLTEHGQDYEDALRPLLTGICDEKFSASDLRRCINFELEGASDKTRLHILKTAWTRFKSRRLQKKSIDCVHSYFLKIVSNMVEEARAAAPAARQPNPPAKSAPTSDPPVPTGLSAEQKEEVRAAIAAMSQEEHEKLTQEATSLTATAFQKWNTVIKQNERSLQAEKMGFEVDQSWKVCAAAT